MPIDHPLLSYCYEHATLSKDVVSLAETTPHRTHHCISSRTPCEVTSHPLKSIPKVVKLFCLSFATNCSFVRLSVKGVIF